MDDTLVRMPIGPCDLVIWVHLVRWERIKTCTSQSNWGESLFACETGENWRIVKWITAATSNNDQGAALLEPRHPPARCSKTQDKKQNKNKTIQL